MARRNGKALGVYMLKVHDILKSNCLYETDHGRNFVKKFGKNVFYY